jgi:hypothetical protein
MLMPPQRAEKAMLRSDGAGVYTLSGKIDR